MTSAIIVPSKSATRYEALLSGENILGENFPRQAASNVAAMVSQTVYYFPWGFEAGDPVTNILTHVSTAGSSITLLKAGIYSRALGLLAASADQSSQYTSVGTKALPISGGPFLAPTRDSYLLALLAVFTGTAPQMIRGIGGVGTSASTIVPGASFGSHGLQLAQTDLPATAAPNFATPAAPLAYWIGWN